MIGLAHVVNIVVPVLLTALLLTAGWAVRRQISTNTELRAALNEAVRALAVLVSDTSRDRDDLGDVRAAVEILDDQHNDLATSVAILKHRVDEHERRLLGNHKHHHAGDHP